MSKFEHFFSSNKVMITSLVITLIAYAVYVVIKSISVVGDIQNIFSIATGVLMFFIALSMYRSFAKHEKNAMNIVTGAAIGIILIFLIQVCVTRLTGIISLYDFLTPVIEIVLYIILLVNHVQINSIHTSSRGRIMLNQVILLVITAYQIFHIISHIVLVASSLEPMLTCISGIAGALARLFISNMIICVETKLNAYKTDRDSAKAEGTWTPSKKAETKEKYFGK